MAFGRANLTNRLDLMLKKNREELHPKEEDRVPGLSKKNGWLLWLPATMSTTGYYFAFEIYLNNYPLEPIRQKVDELEWITRYTTAAINPIVGKPHEARHVSVDFCFQMTSANPVRCHCYWPDLILQSAWHGDRANAKNAIDTSRSKCVQSFSCRWTSRNILLAGNFVIPRIHLFTDDDECPFVMKRTQLPVRPAFAMTIHKSQGQTLNEVAIYPNEPVFTHGQLYVAFPRATNPQHLHVAIPNNTKQTVYSTNNVVYKEVLL
ncbi:hypothetical protein BCR42DRAFT_444403 [Absidia repens]|uniref:P-loop containing nucleoside triphosphate hydrolase protein n=1 Tax=Absidia repens TaxID=90262 RepID=A0A1X2HRA1_9FUNG|nr:hypothetical protein BCR42DRAFT_444403 [Absidia repens]